MALRIPVWGCFARSRLGAPLSFPNQPGDVELGVFQPAPSGAVDFHFRPRINFGARFRFVRTGVGGLRLAPAWRARRHRSAAGNGHGVARTWSPRRCARTRGTCRGGSTWAVARVGGTRSLFAFSGSFGIPNANGMPGFASTETRAGFFPMGWGGPCSPFATRAAPSGESRWSGMRTAAPVAARSARAGWHADRAAATWTARAVAAGHASRRC